MADALCGPSNALHTFQKHTSVDRTLQQDRLALRQSPQESFRSTPTSAPSFLDAEFEAFQSSNPLEPGFPEPPSVYQSQARDVHYRGISQPDWASDFQNLQLDGQSQSPIPAAQFRQYAPLQRRSPGAWHQEFLSEPSLSDARNLQDNGSPYYDSRSRAPFQHQALPLQPPERAARYEGLQKETANTHDTIEQGAFEKAFEEAHAAATRAEEQPATDISLEPQNQNHVVDDVDSTIPYRIGSDRILDESIDKDMSQGFTDEGDDLARTAGQLLENVKGDISQKFQESSFLSLMRQLRDREVKLEGDKFTTAMQPLHPGGANYPSESKAET
ncbi:uncharacterized protein KY384_002105 [Bacidia gigantensis]|uniref:uncharacterized protein n=1 Tax=Bacidia gigantensis TaxID=2732470 RepID=UPI001D058C59|nr:uncharacterized protein KY384_002105 [Bacidia gigantensis]KAG8533322.1 hypothetical protein KY384_002105 [Bacidia gigantensis]